MIARLGQRHGFARLFAAALTVLTTLLAPAVTYAIQVPGGVPTTTLSNTAAYATGVTYTVT
ncbi:MAG: hypothetical protein JXE06_08435, partial [Coriobacteriia bacterium]|nr:hypothetical protein [Coriobacteriia bacterium]